MDPKMDSGYLAPGESAEAEYNVMRSLLPEEVIGIMDQLLCHEVILQNLALSIFKVRSLLMTSC